MTRKPDPETGVALMELGLVAVVITAVVLLILLFQG